MRFQVGCRTTTMYGHSVWSWHWSFPVASFLKWKNFLPYGKTTKRLSWLIFSRSTWVRPYPHSHLLTCLFPLKPIITLYPWFWAHSDESPFVLGVKGQVFDGSGKPVPNAVVEVEGRKNMCPFRTNQHGEYYRLLVPGVYTFKVRLQQKHMLSYVYSTYSYAFIRYD